jgi:large subunit ribosomal protein L18
MVGKNGLICWPEAGQKRVGTVNHEKTLQKQRQRRVYRVRNKVRGCSTRPRLTVFRSHKHIYAQVVDDLAGRTLVSATSLDKEVSGDAGYGGNKSSAALVGKALAERAIAAGISEVAFDRGMYKYHGRVASLADAAREAGLKF